MKRDKMRKTKRSRKQVQRTPVESFRVQLAEKIHFSSLLLKQKTTKMVFLQHLCTLQPLHRSPLDLLGTA